MHRYPRVKLTFDRAIILKASVYATLGKFISFSAFLLSPMLARLNTGPRHGIRKFEIKDKTKNQMSDTG
jgi:hypothetical protein